MASLILGLGHQQGGGLSFSSPQTILGADVVLVDFDGLFQEFGVAGLETGVGAKNLNEQESVRFRAIVKRRQDELLECLAAGAVLFVQLGAVHSSIVYKDSSTRSGNQSFGDPYLAMMRLRIGLRSGHGQAIEASERIEGAQQVFQSLRSHLQHEAILDEATEHPFLFVSRTRHPVGAILKHRGGTIVLMPKILDAIEAIGMQLELFAKTLTEATTQEPRPAWATEFQVRGEYERSARLTEEAAALQQAIENRDRALAALTERQRRQLLFTATGESLRAAVAEAFAVLGFDVDASDSGTRDLQITSEARPAVVEVKGLTKSAAQRDARQLEQWVGDYAEKHDELLPKGILVANAWRELPPSERLEASFPNQMLDYSSKRNHCLITGLQLLGLVQEVEADPTRCDAIVSEILNTVGPFARYQLWDEVLSHREVDSGSG